jgi:lipopolysaccharide export system permease protein
MAAFNFFFIDQVLPRSNTRLATLQMDIGRKKPTLAMREQAVNPLQGDGYYLRASRIEAGTGRMRDVTIYDLTLPTVRRVVYADSGIMFFEANGRDLRFQLWSGAIHEYRPEEIGTVRVTVYRENIIRARDVANKLELGTSQFERGDRELSTCEMIDRQDLNLRTAQRALLVREAYTARDLRSTLRLALSPDATIPEPVIQRHCGRWRDLEDVLKRYIFPAKAAAQSPPPARAVPDTVPARPMVRPRAVGPVALSGLSAIAEMQTDESMQIVYANRLGVEIHKKFTISVACLNFVIIGIALALRFPRGGIGLVLGGSLVIFTLFYVCLTAGEELANRGILRPATAMWAPNVVIAVFGLLGIRAASRTMGSTRGGDLADLLEVVGGWLRRRRA